MNTYKEEKIVMEFNIDNPADMVQYKERCMAFTMRMALQKVTELINVECPTIYSKYIRVLNDNCIYLEDLYLEGEKK